ncbi:hypothetical protein GIB67_037826 [Kingdonia uniflora]|uniref:RNA polymerase Rpb4/RPC9 core domain-containing protein n=1 Tax=Kingdonia uniflora TaxID=39325 RepID=A0A7J7NAL6_9MAGN|nr:hypothetical protein GIB67_037826 [Kingdonia uniflora]
MSSDKWGNKFPISSGKKYASKPKTVATKGKDTSSSKKGRTVDSDTDSSDYEELPKFSTSSKSGGKASFETPTPTSKAKLNTSVSSKSGGKYSFETSVGKGYSGKGGKAGGKSTVPKATVAKFKVEEELPDNASCLMDCEAADILEGIQGQRTLLSNDPTIKLPGSFDRGLDYATFDRHYTDPQSARRVLEKLKRHNISDSEICLISNVCPETIPEVYALVPSLKTGSVGVEITIKEVLQELAKLKSFN